MKILANSNMREYEVSVYPRHGRQAIWRWILSETSATNARSMAEEVVAGYEPDEILEACIGEGWSETRANQFVDMLVSNMDEDFTWIGEDLACSRFTYRVNLLR